MVNARLKHLRSITLGFRNDANCRLRNLLEAGENPDPNYALEILTNHCTFFHLFIYGLATVYTNWRKTIARVR